MTVAQLMPGPWAFCCTHSWKDVYPSIHHRARRARAQEPLTELPDATGSGSSLVMMMENGTLRRARTGPVLVSVWKVFSRRSRVDARAYKILRSWTGSSKAFRSRVV